MPRLLLFAIVIMLGPACAAEVFRCADAAGNVSYTDGACPAGASRVGRVAVPEPVAPTPQEAGQARLERNAETSRPSPPSRTPMEAAAPPPQAPAGPIIIDPRAGADRPADAGRGDGYSMIDDGYAYPGVYRQPRPPRDMRPRLRNCDATGCEDRQGNHYDGAGRLDRYQGLDGKTCRPIGTTTICR